MWLGRIAEASGQSQKADEEFSETFELLQNSTERLSRAHGFYGEILEARGDLAGAVQHLKLALATRSYEHPVESAATA